MNLISNIISTVLIGTGVAGFAVSSKPLLENKDVDVPLNVLGINRSPYGEIFAMAMQGPIDTYWHAVETSGQTAADHDHSDPDHTHDHADPAPPQAGSEATGLSDRLRVFIDGMGAGLEERTNPRAATDAHKFFIRRGIEDKLRFAYNLDPSHYANYNAYHFFLTEPLLGTRPELTPHAAKLAHETISYCLSQRSDPRQALTAAAAAGNVVELMLNDRHINKDAPRFTVGQMSEVLKVMDQSISLFSHLANEWEATGTWENLSPLRLAEVNERFKFVMKIRDSHEQSIRRLKGLSGDSRISSRPNGINDTP